ncbi:hypothetical protein IU459_06990 [Nocardia amamiensis]|uniref:Lipoprotein n=1 Tax=Nocardia amamiensis TaxID=404578 RepID=A0ABS0CM58_9NOCA|nr:hypothetical protein [Nocardia amamiensis]MBF6297290.1 hypothetical protein [Nocardia amamiensis]
MVTWSGPVILVACALDRSVMPDPAVRYRPEPITGRRYQPVSVAPRPAPTSKPIVSGRAAGSVG